MIMNPPQDDVVETHPPKELTRKEINPNRPAPRTQTGDIAPDLLEFAETKQTAKVCATKMLKPVRGIPTSKDDVNAHKLCKMLKDIHDKGSSPGNAESLVITNVITDMINSMSVTMERQQKEMNRIIAINQKLESENILLKRCIHAHRCTPCRYQMEEIAALKKENGTLKETVDSLTDTISEIHPRLMELERAQEQNNSKSQDLI